MGDMSIHCQNGTAQKVNSLQGEIDKSMEQENIEKDRRWIIFLLENTKYAIDAGYVLNIITMHEIIPFKNSPVHCPGIIWNKNGMVRLLDMNNLFGQGYYWSAMTGEDDELPAIAVIELEGQKRGIIVDKIVNMEHLGTLVNNTFHEISTRSRYLHGAIIDKQLNEAIPVLNPDSLLTIEFEPPDAKIDWNSRIDIKMLAKERHETGAIQKPPIGSNDTNLSGF